MLEITDLKRIDRTFTIYFVIIALLITGGLGIISYKSARAVLIKNTQQALVEKTTDGAEIIKQKLSSRIGSLEILAKTFQMTNLNESWENKRELLRGEINRLNYIDIGVADLNGELRLVEGEKIDISNAEYFQQVLGGRNFISEPFLMPNGNKSAFAIAVPIKKNGQKIIGSLVSFLDSKIIEEVLEDIGFTQNGNSYLAVGDRVILGDSPSINDDKYETSAFIDNTGWRLVSEISKSEILSQLKGLARVSVVFSLLSPTMVVFFSIFISDSFKFKRRKKHGKIVVSSLCTHCTKDCKVFVIGKGQVLCGRYRGIEGDDSNISTDN